MCPEWASVDVKTRYVGLELSQRVVTMLGRIAKSEANIRDATPGAQRVGRGAKGGGPSRP